MNQTVPRLLRNLGFGLITAAVFLGGTELTLRALGIPDPGIYAGDIGSVWWLRPDLPPRSVPHPETGGSFELRTNSLGYRGPEPSPGGIAAMGCSTTLGWGVEEDEAWPAQLAQRLGRDVLNGGVPGHSTRQALATIHRALVARPATVILGYIVRDAQRAPRPDHLARPRLRLHLLQVLRPLRDRDSPASTTVGVPRVPPDRYRANLEALIALVRQAGAEPVLLAFPMQQPAEEHLAVLRSFAPHVPVIEPQLPPEAYFADDPLHLTPAGHARLAAQVAEALE